MGTIKQKDLKLLWGRAAGRCSVCRHKLAHDGKVTGVVPIGEQAHIVAEEVDGPRGRSSLSEEERNSYPNLILLCPTCHTTVDKAASDFPVERLHMLKTQHELWVAENLADVPTAEDPAILVYSHLIDATVELADLEHWEAWTSFAMSPDQEWPEGSSRRLFELHRVVESAIWPGRFPELEHALCTFKKALWAAFAVFNKHAEQGSDGRLRSVRFYKLRPVDKRQYDLLLDQFESWSLACSELLRESTRAANWVAASVRRHLNPTFFLLHGKFCLMEGPGPSLGWTITPYEYTSEELRSLPDATDARIGQITREYERTRGMGSSAREQ